MRVVVAVMTVALNMTALAGVVRGLDYRKPASPLRGNGPTVLPPPPFITVDLQWPGVAAGTDGPPCPRQRLDRPARLIRWPVDAAESPHPRIVPATMVCVLIGVRGRISVVRSASAGGRRAVRMLTPVLRSMRFRPALRDGTAVPAWHRLTLGGGPLRTVPARLSLAASVPLRIMTVD